MRSAGLTQGRAPAWKTGGAKTEPYVYKRRFSRRDSRGSPSQTHAFSPGNPRNFRQSGKTAQFFRVCDAFGLLEGGFPEEGLPLLRGCRWRPGLFQAIDVWVAPRLSQSRQNCAVFASDGRKPSEPVMNEGVAKHRRRSCGEGAGVVARLRCPAVTFTEPKGHRPSSAVPNC